MAALGSSSSNVEMNKVDSGYDPFILATLSGNLDDFRKAIGFTEIVQYMLNFVSSRDTLLQMLNVTDADGDTPLHDAAKGEHLEVTRLLLGVGASPKMTNNRGKTPTMLVRTDLRIRSIWAAAAAAENGD